MDHLSGPDFPHGACRGTLTHAPARVVRARRLPGFKAAVLSGLLMSLGACGGGDSGDSAPGGAGGGAGAGGGGGGTAPPAYTVGGTVSGLGEAELVLRNDVTEAAGGTFEELTVSADGEFAFATSLPSGATYEVFVAAQPQDPVQECTVSNGSGKVAASDVTDVSVECVTLPLTLSSSSPGDRTSNVAVTTTPILTFSTPLNTTTVTTAEVTLDTEAGSQDIALEVSGTELTVTPTNSLSALTAYTLRVGTGVQGNGSARLANPVIVEFTTEGDLPTPERGIHLRSPEVELSGMQAIKYCYYFRTSNTEDLGIRTWQSHFTPHVRNVVLLLTRDEKRPSGTLSSTNCGLFFASNASNEAWTYAAYTADAQMDFPVDDGAGRPVGQLLEAAHPAFLMIDFFNETTEPVSAYVELAGAAYDAGVEFTPAWTYTTYNNSISIPPNSTGSETQVCPVAEELQFFRMTTHSHKRSVQTYIREGMTNLFESFDFANPGERRWDMAPYHSFASGLLTYQCDYSNPTALTITSGPSIETDEQCIAIGHVFPMTRPMTCFDGLGPFQLWL